MSRDKQTEEMTQYYVLRDKDTGMYFRGKGVNRWGKYFNQATIYRVKGTAEASAREVSWHGEKVEIVPIQIFENTAGYRKASELAEEIFAEIEKEIDVTLSIIQKILNARGGRSSGKTVLISKLDMLLETKKFIAELKKKYIGEDTNVTTKETEDN